MPQGFPLFPDLYILFNADLVNTLINCTKGAIAFIDNFFYWAVEPSVDSNTVKLQEELISKMFKWSKYSGSFFKVKKILFIYFNRNNLCSINPVMALIIESTIIGPSPSIKILGIILNKELYF